MEEKGWFWLGMILLFIIVANVVIFVSYQQENNAVGHATYVLEEELKDCCTYYEEGEERTCAVLKRYDCSYCEDYCN